jgi:hypothetical protein
MPSLAELAPRQRHLADSARRVGVRPRRPCGFEATVSGTECLEALGRGRTLLVALEACAFPDGRRDSSSPVLLGHHS